MVPTFTLFVVFLVIFFVCVLIFYKMSLFAFLSLMCLAFASSKQINDTDSLRLISVFLRHGARTPELKDTYPNDPYELEAFLPMGWGQLTNHGKEMAFTLGKSLRKRYNKFLGETYIPEAVYAQSTDYDRTKVSALLALAGLYPPSQKQRWNEQLAWQPIPYDYDKDKYDYTLKRPNKYCPTYMEELEKVLNSEESVTFLKTHKNTMRYISNHTGKPINKLSDLFALYQTLTAELTMNLTLPEWTKKVYPEEITKIAVKRCEMENYNTILKKLNGGRMLKKVRENMVAKTEGLLHPPERKIFIYSGHENNVINILAALDLYKPHFPKYSSAVLIELHYLRSRQDYAVKISYMHDVYKDPEEFTLPNCDVFCPLNKFLKITEKHIPRNYTAECGSFVNLD